MTVREERAEAAAVLARKHPVKMLCSCTTEHIEAGTPCKGTRCPIKLCVAEQTGVPHGYVHVDSTGISITRRKDYREKAFSPAPVLKFLINYDNPKTRHLCKPFNFVLYFHHTTPVAKSTYKRRKRINDLRRGKRRTRSRIVGVTSTNT